MGPAALSLSSADSATLALREVRDEASVLARSAEQLTAAGAAVNRVQRLVERLRDAAVVGLDRGIHPRDRAALQKQVDLSLREIDHTAEETLLNSTLLNGRAPGSLPDAVPLTPVPFRAIGTGALGLHGLAVRSADQALAASGVLDVAARRLERLSATVTSATARYSEAFSSVMDPAASVTGKQAIPNPTAALNAVLGLRARLVSSPHAAASAQGDLQPVRVARLLV